MNRLGQREQALDTFNTLERKALADVYGKNMTAYKFADQTVSASTTFVNDDTINVELARGQHRVTMILPTPSMTAAGGLKLQFIAVNGLEVVAVRLNAVFLLDATAPAVLPIAALSSAVNGGTTNAWTSVLITGTIDVKSQGRLQLQWAQQAASGTTTVGLGASVDTQQL